MALQFKDRNLLRAGKPVSCAPSVRPHETGLIASPTVANIGQGRY